jgi:hypothetical protein
MRWNCFSGNGCGSTGTFIRQIADVRPLVLRRTCDGVAACRIEKQFFVSVAEFVGLLSL